MRKLRPRVVNSLAKVTQLVWWWDLNWKPDWLEEEGRMAWNSHVSTPRSPHALLMAPTLQLGLKLSHQHHSLARWEKGATVSKSPEKQAQPAPENSSMTSLAPRGNPGHSWVPARSCQDKLWASWPQFLLAFRPASPHQTHSRLPLFPLWLPFLLNTQAPDNDQLIIFLHTTSVFWSIFNLKNIGKWNQKCKTHS